MKILIVIPHYGSDDHLFRLFPSIGLLTDEVAKCTENVNLFPTYYGEVLVVNNNIENWGFTKACNIGLRYGLTHDFDVVWLLNNDTEVKDIDYSIEQLNKEFTDHPMTGVVGMKILSMDDPDFIHHGGTGPSIPTGVHKVGYVSQGMHTARSVEGWVTGASMAISTGCVMAVGEMDEKLENYYSDSDFCYRARYAGYSVIYLPIAILHKIGQSANPSPEQMKIMQKDFIRFQAKWLNGKAFFDLANEVF